MSLKTAMENTRKLVATLWDAESYTNKQGQPDRKWFKVGVIQQCNKGLYHVKVRFLGITVWLTGFPPKEEESQPVQTQTSKQMVDDLAPF